MNSPSQPDPWIGRLIGERQRYRLDKRLGAGSMGDVFLAMDTLLGKQVALKLLKDSLVVSEELRKRFEREVAVCAALQSDHIVEVSDYGVTAEGNPFYVMEYLRGQSLKQLLQQDRLSVERTAGIITQVCDGLQLAHEGVTLWRDGATAGVHINVVHRNLKPENIFLVSTALGELVKILDFSIAKIRDESVEQTNSTSAFIGTYRYAAPEQLRVAQDLDGRADIYSLGIILYEMLSGTNPFGLVNKHKISEMSWALAHASKPPMPLRSQPGLEQLSLELEAVVMRCLQKAPNERFASVDELKRALQAAAKLGISGTDIAQPLSSSGQGDDKTILRPLTPSVPGPDATIAQTAASSKPIPDATIAQTAASSKPIPDATIAQTAASTKPIPDATIAQTAASTKPIPDATIAQPLTPSRQQVPDATIVQTSTPSRKTFPSFPPDLLLPLATGIAIGLALIGAIFVYIQSQPRDRVLNDIKTLKTEAKYEECMNKAETVARDSRLYNDAQKLLNECRMERAKKK